MKELDDIYYLFQYDLKGDTMDKEQKDYLFGNGVIILTFPAISYLLAYVKEYAYCSYFGIPIEFISLDLMTILLMFIKIFIILMPVFYFMNFLSLIIWYDDLKSPIIRQFVRCSKYYIVLLVFYIMNRDISGLKTTLFVAFLFITFLYFIFPIITQWKVSGYKNKLIEQEKVENKSNNNTLQYNFFRKVGITNVNIIAIVIIISILTYQVGLSEASTKENFLIPSNDNSKIVLRIYGENIICAKYDRDNQKVLRQFSIVKLGEDSNLFYIETDLGKVEVNKPK